jgi:hypothetical protein
MERKNMELIPADFVMVLSLVLGGVTVWSIDRMHRWLRAHGETHRERPPKGPRATLELLRDYRDARRSRHESPRLAIVFWLSSVGAIVGAAVAFWWMLF